MSLFCHECGSTDLRTSHLRPRDYIRLMIMKYPVRCRTCMARTYAPLGPALALPRSQHLRPRAGNHNDNSGRN
jgi:hypothetical protein